MYATLLQLTLKGRLGEKITSSRSSDDTTRKVHRYSELLSL